MENTHSQRKNGNMILRLKPEVEFDEEDVKSSEDVVEESATGPGDGRPDEDQTQLKPRVCHVHVYCTIWSFVPFVIRGYLQRVEFFSSCEMPSITDTSR